MKFSLRAGAWRSPSLALIALLACSTFLSAQAYQQTNLDSDFNAGTPDNPGLAPNQSVHLLNPWGLTSSNSSPWWIADNNGGVSTLYAAPSFGVLGLVVNIPPVVSGVGTGTPTGVVFTGGTVPVKGQPALPGTTFHFGSNTAVFTFVSEDGRVSAWLGNGTDAIQIIPANNAVPDPNVGPVYKGATVAPMTIGGPLFLYVTNFRQNKIEVYDNNFNPVDLNRGRGIGGEAFRDPQIPRDFAPFNVQEANGNLYVTYAKQSGDKHDDFDAPGNGFVDKFSPTGQLLQRLDHGNWLNAPWGIALAPSDFGFYSNHLFVGNAGSGQIAVYDADSGRFDGLLRDNTGANGHALQNDRLWALRFGNDAGAGPHNWLFFTAGILGEQHGLFGFFTPDPNSATTVPDSNGDEQ
jgi:uncharacterized protein (TIGR03118 family)